LKAATTDPETIQHWWKEHPHANIALATGTDGLTVLDVDTAERKLGQDSLNALIAQYGPLPATLTARTGSGGTHYYFISLEPVKNSKDKIGEHLDIRGVAGYVILPPSNHKSGGRYEWLNDLAIADIPEWLYKAATADTVDPTKDEAQKFKREDFHDKYTTDDIKKVLKAISADDRDIWWKVGAALKDEYGEEGRAVWDEWSETSPKYQASMQDPQWRSFKPGQITIGTIIHYAKEQGWRGFDAETAKELGQQQDWLWVVATKRFLNTQKMIEVDKEQFDSMFLPMFRKGDPNKHALRSEDFPRVDSPTYWPEKPLFVEEGGLRKVNMWRPSGVTPEAGAVERFLHHVRYLFPDAYEQNIVLDYLAFQVQFPGEKVHWALVIWGDQGNGKSYLGHVMKLVLGPHNVRNIHSDILHETFTGWQRNTQFVIVEEMMARQRLELMNKLKPMITEPWCSIREMYKPPYEQPNRLNFLFLSNHSDSLIIDNKDRRYCILKTKAPPHSDGIRGYYRPLWDWTNANAPALLHYLRNVRDLSQFEPKAHAPMTEDKRVMIVESMPPLDSWIAGQVEAQEWPFNVDLISPSDLARELPRFGLRANPKEVGRAFGRLGYLDLGRRRVGESTGGGCTPVSLWAVRNFDTYEQLDGQRLRVRWLQQGDNAPKESVGNPKDEDVLQDHRRKGRPPNMVSETKPM
jgi:hypothetical protein